MGCDPQLPCLLVYHRLEHLGLHSTRQPFETSLNTVTFQHSSWLCGEEGDGPGWEPGGPTGRPLFGKLQNRRQQTVHILLRSSAGKRGERRGGFSEAHLQQPRLLGQGLGSPGEEAARWQDSGQVLSAVPGSSESRFWSGSGSGQVCLLADSMRVAESQKGG